MRLLRLSSLPVLAALAVMAGPAAAQQVSANIQIGTPQRSWGHEVTVYDYVPETFGDWHKSYRRWQPVTVYFANGHYYPNRVRGARAVTIYRSQGRYFLPPRDKEWDHKDRRYNYDRRPVDDDYRARPTPPPPNHRP